MSLPKKVKLVEVSPRDGLQNESTTIPSTVKVDFINRLSETGLSTIEVTSFVSKKKIPQLADNKTVFADITKQPSIHYPVLVPNTRGLTDALTVDAKEIAVFIAASETFCQKNIDCSIATSFERIAAVIEIAKKKNLTIRAYISCSFGCPYEGEIDPHAVADMAKKLYDLGCSEISFGDTIGVATPNKTVELIHLVLQQNLPIGSLAMHMHDTYGQALANIYAALEEGVSIIDSSVAGLGGCPYAKGATGNVASEDVLYLLNGLGIETGVDLKKLIAVGQFISDYFGRETRSRVALAHLRSES